MKLSYRLTILFSLMAILPTAIMGYVGYDTGKRIILEETRHHLETMNILKSRELERWIKNSKSSIEELAQRPLVRQYASVMAASHEMLDASYREAHRNIIENHLTPRLRYGNFRELFVMCSPQGHISASTDNKQNGKYRDNRKYFIEGKKQTYVEGSYYSPALEQASMIVSTPIKGKDGNTVAVLAGRLNMNELTEIMTIEHRESNTADTYLVNAFNFFVSEPRYGKDFILKKAVHTTGIDTALSGKDGIGFYNDYRGVSVIGAYKWLPEFRMCIITEIDQSEAFAPVVRLSWIAAGSVIAICIAVALLGIYFARTISLPLVELASGAGEIGGGNFDYRVEIKRNDEIGALASATNEMAAKLKETHTSVKNLQQEIAERRQAEEALLFISNRQEALLSAIPDIIMEVDSNKVYTWANGPGIEFFGEDVIGKEAASYFKGEQETYSLVKPIFNGNENVIYVESWQRRKDGEKRLLAWWCRVLKDKDGNVTGALSSARDITEYKRADEEIRKLNAELEQRVADRTALLEAANKELEAFSYSVSHDLRSPLQHITGFAELLNKRAAESLDDKNKHYLKVITDSTIRMGRLIDDFLAFSRMGRAEMMKKKTNLDSLVKEILKDFQRETEERNVDLKIGSLPEVYGDSSMLRLVLINLISNAFKFTKNSDNAVIEIGSSACDNKGEVYIYVRDNGAGFDMKYTNKLFGIFQRLHRAEDFEGTGIGLANVRRIINRHGGRVWAEGKVGEGATFWFTVQESGDQR
ncbi:MAG: ATP-binding protein [Desulfobacterales bacterium]